MYKLANQVIDAHDDVCREFLTKIAKMNPKAYMMTTREREGLADDDFALSIITKKASKLNKFPIIDKHSAWISSQYFNETHYRLPKEAAEIAAHWIHDACQRFQVKPSPAVEVLNKTASTNIYCEPDLPASSRVVRTVERDLEKFAEVEKICNNETFATYVFNTVDNVKLGNSYFQEYSDQMPIEYRVKYANSLQKRAGVLGFTLEGKLEKYAANSYSAHVDSHLALRRDLVDGQDPKFKAALTKMATMKDDMLPLEFAKLLHGFDKMAKIDQYYGGYLVNPYESTISTQINPKYIYKTASTRLTDDAINKLAIEKYAKIKEYFGYNVADELKKHGSVIFESLPADAKEIIAGIADGSL